VSYHNQGLFQSLDLHLNKLLQSFEYLNEYQDVTQNYFFKHYLNKLLQSFEYLNEYLDVTQNYFFKHFTL
jgi:hypothetical protein